MELNGFGLDQQQSSALPLVTTKITNITVIHHMLLFWTAKVFWAVDLANLLVIMALIRFLNSSYRPATIQIIRNKIE